MSLLVAMVVAFGVWIAVLWAGAALLDRLLPPDADEEVK